MRSASAPDVVPWSTTPDAPDPAAETGPRSRPHERRERRRGLGSIQTKLLVMMLLTSIVSTVVVGWFGYRSGTESLRRATYARLTEVGDARLRAVQEYMADLHADLALDARGVAAQAFGALSQAYDALGQVRITTDERSRLEQYYATTFVSRLERGTGKHYDAAGFVPQSGAAAYLQAHYTAYSGDPTTLLQRDDAGDGSAWTEVNKRIQPYFREAIAADTVDDALILDADGDVVWSAKKGADLGVNVVTGNYRGGGLQEVFDTSLRSNTLGYVATADFEAYKPAFGAPTSFLATPIGSGSTPAGVLVFEISSAKFNNLLGGRVGDRVFTGLGRTGDLNFFAADGTMRTDSRELVEFPKDFEVEAIASGISAAEVQRMLDTKRSVLVLRDRSKASALARRGAGGVIRTDDYLGRDVLAAYTPADLPDLDWTLVTQIGAKEALAPVSRFTRDIVLSTAWVLLLVCAASVLLARVFTRPVQRLVDGVRAVATGQVGAQITGGHRRDEFGDMELAFNDMSSSLRRERETVETQQQEIWRMLSAMMPAPMAERYRGGEQDIATEHEDVSVVYTQIVGFDDLVAARSPVEALALLNTLARGFDDAARSTGIERVRSVGTSFLATSGQVVHRVDHPRRVVDFAIDVVSMVERFNDQQGADLRVRAGASVGRVICGLVGRHDVVYDLWGQTVDLAYRLGAQDDHPGVYVTVDLKERLGATFSFVSAATITADRRQTEVWQVRIPADRSAPARGAASRSTGSTDDHPSPTSTHEPVGGPAASTARTAFEADGRPSWT